MKVQQKPVSVTVYASIFILLLPFVNTSQHVQTATHTKNNNNSHKLNPKLAFEITLHGFLLWASMGFLTPVGILIIRISNREQCGRRLKILFYVHAISQILSASLATAGAVISIKNFNNSFNNHHQRLGVALYGLVWLQALSGFLRPQRGSKGRSAWFFAHWLLGTGLSLLGVISTYTGLQAYHEKTSRSIKFWTTIFTTEVSILAFFYLFQDKWMYIQQQGEILCSDPIRPTDQHASPNDKQTKLVTDTC